MSWQRTSHRRSSLPIPLFAPFPSPLRPHRARGIIPLLLASLCLPGRAPLAARDCRVGLLPNGGRSQCLNCHTSNGGGPRNAFGRDVQTIVGGSSCQIQFWSPTLAAKDSDGDGRTNGEELQDPGGAWRPGDPAPGDPNLVTLPGTRDDPAATIESVEPALVARDGTTPVSVHGTRFLATTQIRIGTKALLGAQVVSPELITGVAPALGVSERGGPKDCVAVQGAARFTLAGAVAYPDLPPLVLTAVEPGTAARDGSTRITIVGENFLADTKVRVGSRALLSPEGPTPDGSMISGFAPALGATEALGTRDVSVSDGRGKVTLAAALTYVDPADDAQQFRRGDVDGDGLFTMADPIDVLYWLFAGGRRPLDCLAAADPNTDGVINLTDGVYLVVFEFLGGPPPNPPSQACGPLSETDLGCERTAPCR